VLFDVPQKFLSMILEFIYCGKIDVGQEHFQDFTKTLKLLKLEYEVENFLEVQLKIKEEPEEANELFYQETGDSGANGYSKVMKGRENIKHHKNRAASKFKDSPRILVKNVVKSNSARLFMITHPDVCPFCQKRASNPKHRNEHVKYCSENPDRVVSKCPYCGKNFCDPYYVRKHIRSIHAEHFVKTEPQLSSSPYEN
jgi:hypothetical protein